MKIDILTLFPNMFKGPFDESIIRRAQDKKLVEIKIHNLRKWTKDKRKTVDDRPYGGGVGMVLMIEPIYQALRELCPQSPKFRQKLNPKPKNKVSQNVVIATKCEKQKGERIVLLSPQGKVFNQKKARQLTKLNHLVLICGHYEGFDERIHQHLIDEEISIGDYILTGGELPAMIISDTIVRLIPKVLKPAATQFESFSKLKIENSLEYPQYTRPANFKGWKVPEILISGHHRKIKEWQEKKSQEKTTKRSLNHK